MSHSPSGWSGAINSSVIHIKREKNVIWILVFANIKGKEEEAQAYYDADRRLCCLCFVSASCNNKAQPLKIDET